MFLIFATHLNSRLFWRTKLKFSKNVGYSPKFIDGRYELWTSLILNIFINPLNLDPVRVLGNEMVKSIFWLNSNPEVWSDYRCKPANVFYRNEKNLSKFVWFLDTHGRKETFKKYLQAPILFTLQTIWCYSGQRKISTFPSKKIEFLFPPCRVLCLLLPKPTIIEERSTKKQILLKQKRNCSKL